MKKNEQNLKIFLRSIHSEPGVQGVTGVTLEKAETLRAKNNEERLKKIVE